MEGRSDSRIVSPQQKRDASVLRARFPGCDRAWIVCSLGANSHSIAGHAAIEQVPASLPEALDALEADHDYLTEGGVFTPDLIETWLDYKRTHEITPVAQRPHPHEFELYYDC